MSNERRMEIFSLVGTDEQLKKFGADMAKVGWKLKYIGPSGHWLGEPVFEIAKEPSGDSGELEEK